VTKEREVLVALLAIPGPPLLDSVMAFLFASDIWGTLVVARDLDEKESEFTAEDLEVSSFTG
jgi:hypothetical protein